MRRLYRFLRILNDVFQPTKSPPPFPFSRKNPSSLHFSKERVIIKHFNFQLFNFYVETSKIPVYAKIAFKQVIPKERENLR